MNRASYCKACVPLLGVFPFYKHDLFCKVVCFFVLFSSWLCCDSCHTECLTVSHLYPFVYGQLYFVHLYFYVTHDQYMKSIFKEFFIVQTHSDTWPFLWWPNVKDLCLRKVLYHVNVVASYTE